MSEPRLLRTLRGEETDRRPLWLLRQAGRMLPEYRALRAEHSFEELVASPALAAEVTLQPVRRFPFDAAIVFADIMTPAAALGIEFRFDPGPVLSEPLRDTATIAALRVPERDAIAPEVRATLERVRAELEPERAVIGFAAAPLTLASYLVEGRGRPGFPTLRALARGEPTTFERLLATLAELSREYLVGQYEAGADVVQVFDSWAGLLDVATWRALVRPHLEALLADLVGAGIPTIYFANDATQLTDELPTLPCHALQVCWRSDLAALHAQVAPGKAVQGNLDPAVLLAGPEATQRAARALLAHVPARGHVVNLGHGVQPETPLESVAALVETIHAETQVTA